MSLFGSNITCFALTPLSYEPNVAYEKKERYFEEYVWIVNEETIKCCNYMNRRKPLMYIGLHYVPEDNIHLPGWYYFDENTGDAKTRLITLPNNKTYYACDVRSTSYGMFLKGWQYVSGYYCYFDEEDYSLRCCLTPLEYNKFIFRERALINGKLWYEYNGMIFSPEVIKNRTKDTTKSLYNNMPYALSDEMPPDKN